MLIMTEEGIRGGICQAVYRYAKANNKYMKNYDKSNISSYLEYLDANNQYGWAMLEKPPVDDFEWIKKIDLSKFTEEFIRNYDENSDKRYVLEVDVEYPKHISMLHSDLPFLPERMKINKCTKLVCTIEDKKKLCSTHKSFKTGSKSWIKINEDS